MEVLIADSLLTDRATTPESIYYTWPYTSTSIYSQVQLPAKQEEKEEKLSCKLLQEKENKTKELEREKERKREREQATKSPKSN